MATSGGPDIVNDGLVLHLDAGSTKSYPGSGTTWKNLTGDTNGDFTLINGPTFSNGSIVFDGVNDRGDGSRTFIEENYTNNQSITVEAFVNITGYPSGYSGLYSNQGYLSETSPGGFGVNIQASSGSFMRYVFMMTSEDGGTKVSYQNILSENISFNEPHHICYTYDGTSKTVTSYRNGLLSNSSTNSNYYWTTSSASPSVKTPRLAGSPQGGWGGVIPVEYYSLKLYNKALTSSEILQNYNATKSRFNL